MQQNLIVNRKIGIATQCSEQSSTSDANQKNTAQPIGDSGDPKTNHFKQSSEEAVDVLCFMGFKL